jgi:hypothetical protein
MCDPPTAALPAEEPLQHATEALARFRDVAVAQAERYLHYDGYERSKNLCSRSK